VLDFDRLMFTLFARILTLPVTLIEEVEDHVERVQLQTSSSVEP